MPPKKFDVANKTGDEGTPAKESKATDGVNIEDLNLPKSIVARLAKAPLPTGTQIQGNAMLALSKSATVFVNHLANAANGDVLRSNKRTITPQNVFAALEEIEFSAMIPLLQANLAKYNELQVDKRNKSNKLKIADKTAEEDMEGEHANKRARLNEEGSADIVDLAEEEIIDDDAPDDEEEAAEEEDDDADGGEEEEADAQEDAEEAQEEEDEALDNGEDSD